MDTPDHAEPIAEIGLRRGHDRGRIGDDKACHAEYDDTERIHPMIDTYGQLPHIYFS